MIAGDIISECARLILLDQQCIQSLKTGYQPGTLRNYRTRSTCYLRYAHFYGVKPFPADEWSLIRYARYLGNGMTSYDTVKQYMSAVKRLHELGSYPFPSPKELHTLAMEMRAIKFELAGPIKKSSACYTAVA